jgi:hypothetical protein
MPSPLKRVSGFSPVTHFLLLNSRQESGAKQTSTETQRVSIWQLSQILTASYPAVLAKMRSADNQWAESAFLRELERQGGIKRISLGPTIEAQLDYRRNPGAGVQATELAGFATDKTEILEGASYTPAEIVVPMTWSKLDEATNPSENQKIALVKQMLTNAINSHDDVLEQALFTTTTNGFGPPHPLWRHGHRAVGTIDSSTSTMVANQQSTYVDDTDIESAFTTVWNNAPPRARVRNSPTLDGLGCGHSGAV